MPFDGAAIKHALSEKLGPLPAWAWVAVAIGGYVVYRFVTGGSSSSTPAATTATVPSTGGYAGGGGWLPTQGPAGPTCGPGTQLDPTGLICIPVPQTTAPPTTTPVSTQLNPGDVGYVGPAAGGGQYGYAGSGMETYTPPSWTQTALPGAVPSGAAPQNLSQYSTPSPAPAWTQGLAQPSPSGGTPYVGGPLNGLVQYPGGFIGPPGLSL